MVVIWWLIGFCAVIKVLLSAPCLGAPLSRDFKDYSAQIHKETPPCECVIILAAKKNNSKVTKKLLTS